MSQPIILYDIDRQAAEGTCKPFTPNAWKTRIELNIKGIPYKTVQVNFIDLADTLKKHGISPHSQGIPYTVPAIFDPNTNKAVMDSWAILEYLEEQYPSAPTLLPANTKPFVKMFCDIYQPKFIMGVVPIMVVDIFDRVNPVDKAYFRETREHDFGSKLEDIPPKGEKRVEALKAVQDIFDEFKKWKGEATFFSGETPSFADVWVIAWMAFAIKSFGADHDVSKAMLAAGDGEWAKHWSMVEKWTTV